MKSTSNSTPYTPPRRNPFQQLSNNVSYSSSPDLPQILDYKSYHSARQSQAGFNDNISPESHADSCTSGGSTVLEHSEYRRLAIQKNRDSRRFDDEFEILSPTPVPSGIYADIHHHCEKTEVGPWRLGRTLGRGASGSVRLARNVETNQLGAVKIMSKEYVRRVMIEKGREKTKYFWTNSMEREIIIMKMIRHPNVLRMYDVWENKYELYLVLEYIDGGDLYDYMISRGRLSEFEAIKIFVQILSGLDYCHHFSICHRDLKPENILLDKNQNVRLADFGFAALQPPGWKLARSCGTPHYAAPEVICGVKYNGGTADIWSCGVVLFTLLCGHVPFDDDDTVALLQKVKFGKFEMPKHLSLDAQDLIRRMLIVNPEKRINTDEIWRHPLITRYFDEGERTARKSAPSYEEIAKPVSSAEIDRVILESMRSLWFGVEPEVIKQALLSPE
ncbi:kinase-like domain-containing protein [Kalaharituber pfeilii]|nr:kinase-like domain-containing protein [Kalaharituber pfeilii]